MIVMYEIFYIVVFMILFFALLEKVAPALLMRVLVPHPCKVCGKHHGPMLVHAEEE